MSSRVSSKARPLSAIFLGDSSLDISPRTQLPSPPASNSQDSGSTTGGSLRLKGKPPNSMSSQYADYAEPRPGSRTGDRRLSSDEDDFENDGDHTARLSKDVLVGRSSSTYSRASSRAGVVDNISGIESSTLNRAQTLAARNRQFLERLSSPSPVGRLSTPPSTHSPNPHPPGSGPNSNGASSRSTFSRARHESRPSISGSETERERGMNSSDDHSTPPSSASQQRFYENEDPRVLPYAEQDRPQGSHTINQASRYQNGTARPALASASGSSATLSRRKASVLLESGDNPLFTDAINQAVGSIPPTRKSPHRTRNPLPREFRDQPTYVVQDEDLQSEPGSSKLYDPRQESVDGSIASANSRESAGLDHRRSYLPPAHSNTSITSSTSTDQNSAGYDSFAHLRSTSLSRTDVRRSYTVRERRPSHSRWASEDIQARDAGNSSERVNGASSRPSTGGGAPWRYQTRGGSAESALAGGGRSLLGEGLRAAGLMRRRPDVDDDLRPRDERAGPRAAMTASNSASSAASEYDNSAQTLAARRDRLLRRGGSDGGPEVPWDRDRVAQWEQSGQRERNATRETFSPAVPGPSRFPSATRDAPPSLTPRPATVMGRVRDPYDDDRPLRTAPLRNHRSQLDFLPSQPSSSAMDRRAAYTSPAPIMRDRDRLGVPPSSSTPVGRNTPQSQQSEHPQLMMDALQTFENNIGRFPPQINHHTIPDCIQAAHVIVQAATSLNNSLRSHAARAVEEQIEAEVAGGDTELWKDIGTDFRESLKHSDDIVRTLTALLLGVSRVMRDAAAPPAPKVPVAGSVGSGSTHSRVMSLSEQALGNASVSSGGSDRRLRSRLSVDGVPTSGRRSTDGLQTAPMSRGNLDAHQADRRDAERYGQGDRGAQEANEREYERRDGEQTRRSLDERPRDFSLQRLAPRAGDSPAVFPERSATSMSTARRAERPAALASRPSLPRVPARLTNTQVRQGDYESPTPRSRAEVGQPRRFPGLAVAPPLSTLPSETIIARRATPRMNSLANPKKTSTGSTTTLRGGPMPSLTTLAARPTTQVTTTTVSTATERESAQRRPPPVRTQFAAAPVVQSPVDSNTERGQRRRTLSTVSNDNLYDLNQDHSYAEVGAIPRDNGNGYRHESLRVRSARDRAALDGGARPQDSPYATLTDRDRKDRRRTMGEVFR